MQFLDFLLQADMYITLFTVLYTIVNLFMKLFCFMKNFIRRKSLKKLLQNTNVAVHIPTRKVDDRIKPVVAMEDYNTYEKIRSVLCTNGFNVILKYIPANGEVEFESSRANVVICGPKNSITVKNVFSNFRNLKFAKDENGWFFKDNRVNKKLYSDQNDRAHQYAFLGKVNYDNNEFILICGIHAIGSDGVAHFLSNRKELDCLLRKVKQSKFWCIICSSYGDHDKQIYNSCLTKYFYVEDHR